LLAGLFSDRFTGRSKALAWEPLPVDTVTELVAIYYRFVTLATLGYGDFPAAH
jgi:hypothetical protein